MAREYLRNDSSARMRSRHAAGERSSWHGTAFLVEALLLLFCLAACTAIIVHAFGLVYAQGHADRDLVTATRLASNVAEEFAANPATTTASTTTEDGFTVTTKVDSKAKGEGLVYHAYITVSRDDELVYELETDRFAKGAS